MSKMEEMQTQKRKKTKNVPWCAPVGGTDDENVLFVGHSVHLCEYLIDDPVGRTTCVPGTASSGFGNGV